MSFVNILKLGVVILLISLTNINTSNAQEPAQIRLLDKNNNMSIVGATFVYGDEHGVSNEQGDIQFHYRKGQTMQLSHLNYGQWFLNDLTILKMIDEKVYYRQSTMVNLYPVTVYALRPNEKPSDELTLGHQDKLAHDGAMVLNQNPAMNSIRKGGNYGFDPVFRGFKYEQLNIVLNGGQSATAACPNRMDPPTSQMAPNMIDRIEVLKGPYALRYGTGIGATINFIPNKLRFTEASDVYGRVTNGYEGNGNVYRNEGQVGFSGSNHDVAIFGSWSQGDDYKTGNAQTIPASFKRGSFGANIGIKFDENNQVKLAATYNLARDADFPALPMDLREDDTWMFNLRHDGRFDKPQLKSWNSTLFGSFVNHLMDNLLKPLDPRMLNASTSATTYNYGGRTEGYWTFENTSLFAGLDFRSEGADGTRTREFLMGPNAGNTFFDNVWQEGHIDKGSLFAEYHFNTTKTEFVLSTRLELNHANINDVSTEFNEINLDNRVVQLNPNLSFGATQNINEELRLGLWLGRAQRSASLTERYINFFPVGQDPFELVGNPQLKAEVNNQFDIILNWENEQTKLEIDVFAGYLQNFISSFIDPNIEPRLPTSPGVRRYVNIDNALKTGFEVNWTQQLLLGLQHQIGVAYTFAQDLQLNEALPEIAPMDLRYTLAGNYLKGKFKPELMFRHVMEQNRISNEFGETQTPAFSLLDIKLQYQITKYANLTAGINNVFDANYYEHLARSVRGNNLPIFAPGQNAFASVNFVF